MRIRSIEFVAMFILAGASCRGQIISTFAGDDVSNTSCSQADGVPALSACIHPSGIATDKAGDVYLSDSQSFKIRKINTAGIITTIAGTTYGYSGDGGPATSAQLTLQGGSPGFSGLAVDGSGNVYISDTHNCVIRLITAATGIITTVAGNHTCGFAGESGLATAASLLYQTGITLDSAGNLYIADTLNNRVRKVDGSGMISTVAGNGDATYDGDNVAATTTGVVSPEGLAFDSAGNLYISESDRIRKVDTNGTITTIAGQTTPVQTPGFSGDGGLATAATLSGPLDLVVDSSGNLYFGDNQNLKVRKINTAGIISTYAGVFGPVSTPLGNGGPATSAYIGNPLGLLLDAAGRSFVYIDSGGRSRGESCPTCSANARLGRSGWCERFR
jgi:trimeric autotransporter adhesin